MFTAEIVHESTGIEHNSERKITRICATASAAHIILII